MFTRAGLPDFQAQMSSERCNQFQAISSQVSSLISSFASLKRKPFFVSSKRK